MRPVPAGTIDGDAGGVCRRREGGSETAPTNDRQARTGMSEEDIPFQFPHWEIPVG